MAFDPFKDGGAIALEDEPFDPFKSGAIPLDEQEPAEPTVAEVVAPASTEAARVGVVRQIASRPVKSFLETFGGMLSGYGLLQQEKAKERDRVKASERDASTSEAMDRPLPEVGQVAIVREPFTGKMVRRKLDVSGRQVNATEVKPDESDSVVADVAAGGGPAIGAALKYAAKNIKTDEAMDRSFWLGDVPSALGSAGAFAATGAVTGPGGTGMAGVSLQIDSAYETVKRRAEELRAQGKEEEAIAVEGKTLEQMIMQAPIGALESFGVGGAPVRWFKATPFGRAVQKGIGRFLFGGTKEGVQETIQGALTDVVVDYGGIEERNALDPQTRAREFGAGFIAGGVMETGVRIVEKIAGDEAAAVLNDTHPGLEGLTAQDKADAKIRAQAILDTADPERQKGYPLQIGDTPEARVARAKAEIDAQTKRILAAAEAAAPVAPAAAEAAKAATIQQSESAKAIIASREPANEPAPASPAQPVPAPDTASPDLQWEAAESESREAERQQRYFEKQRAAASQPVPPAAAPGAAVVEPVPGPAAGGTPVATSEGAPPGQPPGGQAAAVQPAAAPTTSELPITTESVTANEPPVKAGFVRLYHGGTGDTAGSDFSPYLDYAKGYADKSSNGKVFYVDVPQDSAFLRRDEGANDALIGRQVVPDDIANKAQPLPSTPTTPNEKQIQETSSVAPVGQQPVVGEAESQAETRTAPEEGAGPPVNLRAVFSENEGQGYSERAKNLGPTLTPEQVEQVRVEREAELAKGEEGDPFYAAFLREVVEAATGTGGMGALTTEPLPPPVGRTPTGEEPAAPVERTGAEAEAPQAGSPVKFTDLAIGDLYETKVAVLRKTRDKPGQGEIVSLKPGAPATLKVGTRVVTNRTNNVMAPEATAPAPAEVIAEPAPLSAEEEMRLRSPLTQKPLSARLEESNRTNDALGMDDGQVVALSDATDRQADRVAEELGVTSENGDVDRNSPFWIAAKDELEFRARAFLQENGLSEVPSGPGFSWSVLRDSTIKELVESREWYERTHTESLQAELETTDEEGRTLGEMISAGDVQPNVTDPRFKGIIRVAKAEFVVAEATVNAALKDDAFLRTLTPLERQAAATETLTNPMLKEAAVAQLEKMASEAGDADTVIENTRRTLNDKIEDYGKATTYDQTSGARTGDEQAVAREPGVRETSTTEAEKAAEFEAKLKANRQAREQAAQVPTSPLKEAASNAMRRVEESDTSQRLGISPIATTPSDIPITEADLKSVDPEVEKRWQAAKISKKPLITRIGERAAEVGRAISRPYFAQRLDPKTDGQFIEWMRQYIEVPNWSRVYTHNILHGIVATLAKRKYGVFSRLVILPDVLKDIDRGLYDGKPLPFGYQSRDQVQLDLDRFSGIAERFTDIKNAVDTRRGVITALRDELVNRGFLNENVQQFDEYFRHQVLEYYNAKEILGDVGRRPSARTFGWQKGRTGSAKDFNTEYLEAEAEYLVQAFAKIRASDMLAQLKDAADISETLRLEAKQRGVSVESLIPEDYTAWQPKTGNVLYWTKSVPERVLDRFFSGASDLEASDVRDVLAVGGKRETWIIPKRLADTLDHMRPPDEGVITELSKRLNSAWKYWTLFNPRRVSKYMMNNLSGDSDAVMAYDPGIFRYAPAVMRETAGMLSGKKAMSQEMLDLTQRGVIKSGITAQEIGRMSEADTFKFLKGESPGLIKRYFNSVEAFNEWREAILRISAYRRFMERLSRGDTDILAASDRHILSGLTSNEDKAARLSRELLGDYGAISLFGKWMRERLYPFWSWKEINTKRYWRLVKNIKAEGGDVGNLLGSGAVKLTGKVSARAAQMAALYGMVWLWNNLFHRDEEEELSESDRRQMHLILGRDSDGNVRTVRVQGALSDVLGWVGLEDAPADVADLSEGKKTWKEQLSEAGESLAAQMINGSTPLIKTTGEALTQRSLYPNPLDPRPVRDRWQHAARSLSLDRIYNRLAGIPMRKDISTDLFSLIGYSSSPGEAAYYTAKELVSEFKEKNGDEYGSPIPTNRSNALYYYKMSLKYDDRKLAKKWLERYYELGGTPDGINKSVATSHPLGGLSKVNQADFINSLSPQDRKTVERAEEWYLKTFNPQ